MQKNVRQERIMAEFEHSPYLTVKEISEKLGCSEMTIRRDLAYLESAHLIKRLPGGAILHGQEFPVQIMEHFSMPTAALRDEVIAVGKAASSLIKSGDIICVDAGTSARAVVNQLPANFPMTIITTSLYCSFEIGNNPNAQIIQVGGSVHQKTHSTINDLSVDSADGLSADIAILSTKSFRIPNGAYEHTLTLIPPKQFLASLARKIVLCVDHTKFGANSLCIATPLKKIDTIVTDISTPKKDIENLVALGKEVIIADVPSGEIVSHFNKQA